MSRFVPTLGRVCSHGYIVVYAVRQEALLVVLADEGLDVSRLHVESRPTVERLGELLTAA
ncbi:hypothetical protein ACIBF6_07805 [Streptosporangium amethystogenes]|uniref:hypothetical protein n=1 Tax=Streptosporangium amethystogenes TaxID=2002 RepID=UPI003790F21A